MTAAALRDWRASIRFAVPSLYLVGQPFVKAGIAYLTRDWAEMARRSHAALDQA